MKTARRYEEALRGTRLEKEHIIFLIEDTKHYITKKKADQCPGHFQLPIDLKN